MPGKFLGGRALCEATPRSSADNSLEMPLAVRVLERPASCLCCPCCGGHPERFLPIPETYIEECRRRSVEHPLDAWETLNLDTYLCPICGATDRDRLQVLFLSSWLGKQAARLSSNITPPAKHRGALRVLEIAPSPSVANWLRQQPDVLYRSADLSMAGADDCVDITDMARYPDGAFDLVICSHVLEHIPDDVRAMREIRRILSWEGIVVLLVPISKLTEDVVEDPALEDEAERWRRFGQGDHVRIYGRVGFLSRLRLAGLKASPFHPQPAEAPNWGLKADNCLYIGARRESA